MDDCGRVAASKVRFNDGGDVIAVRTARGAPRQTIELRNLDG